MRRDDILLNELYSKINNKHLVNEGIFDTARDKISSFFRNDKPEDNELKKILNQINELKIILSTNGYEPREFLNFDKIKTLSGGSVSSNPQTSPQVSDTESQTTTQPETSSFTSQPETNNDSRFAPRPSTPNPTGNYKFDRFKGLANAKGLKELERQMGSEEVPDEETSPYISIDDFKKLLKLSDAEFTYLEKQGIFSIVKGGSPVSVIKNKMIPRKYIDNTKIWDSLEQRQIELDKIKNKQPKPTRKKPPIKNKKKI